MFLHMADFLFISNFLSDPARLFTELEVGVVWDKRMKARKTASFGVPYNYSQIAYDFAPFPESLRALLPQIEMAVGFRPNNCLLNFYPSG